MLRAPIVVLRTLAIAITLAALALAGPQAVRAQTPVIVPATTAGVSDVESSSAALRMAIQTNTDIPGALSTYNADVSTAASNSSANNVVTGSITVSSPLSVGSTDALVISSTGTLTFSSSGRVTIGAGGGFFLGPGTVSSMIGNPSTSSAFTFSGLSVSTEGGAVLNNGTATITNSRFSGNRAIGQFGGAVSNSGTLTITNSSFTVNQAFRSGGAASLGGTATITNSTFTNNDAQIGGAIESFGTATITNSSFTNNLATSTNVGAGTEGGGAVLVNGGTTTITNSSFSGNLRNLRFRFSRPLRR